MVRYQSKSTLFYSCSILEKNFELVKDMLMQAEVYVYEKNQEIQREGLDEDTGEKDYVMIWEQK